MATGFDSWMWVEAVSALDRADRLQKESFRPRGARARAPTWEPPIDVLETHDALWIIVALPGVALSDVEIVISGGIVTILGNRPIPASLQGAAIHRLEIPYGRFERQVQLPRARFELVERSLRDGCLTLALRKVE